MPKIAIHRLIGLAAGLSIMGATISPAVAVARPKPSLTASPVLNLAPTGATIRVLGKGYDPTVGIYVALCVTPAKGQQPSPCGGGVNTSGSSPASVWISSNPPPYGRTLAIPYRPGGRFDVSISVSAQIGSIDCRLVSCSIVTRADHTRSGDRRFDAGIPVTFSAS